MDINGLLNDRSIPDNVKEQVLARRGMTLAGAKREAFYERYLRDPMRREVGGLLTRGPAGLVMGPSSDPSGISNWVTKHAVPGTMQDAASMAGNIAGNAVAGPLLGGVGAELGGTLGGMLEGKSAGSAALSSAPGAAVSYIIPKATSIAAAPLYNQAISSKASSKIGQATAKLFQKLFVDDPELKPPISPKDMADFYGSGQVSPALQKAGEKLGAFKNKLVRALGQPGFQSLSVSVPMRQADGSITSAPMRLDDAFNKLDQYYGRGYNVQGGLRGGIQSGPDRQLGAMLRANIGRGLRALKTPANPKLGLRIANEYDDLTQDYGVAATLHNVFSNTVTPQGLLNHERLYQNLAKSNNLSHLGNLTGPDATREYLAAVAPGRQRVMPSEGLRLHVPLVSAHIPLGPNTAPKAFVPVWQKAYPVISDQLTNSYVNTGNTP